MARNRFRPQLAHVRSEHAHAHAGLDERAPSDPDQVLTADGVVDHRDRRRVAHAFLDQHPAGHDLHGWHGAIPQRGDHVRAERAARGAEAGVFEALFKALLWVRLSEVALRESRRGTGRGPDRKPLRPTHQVDQFAFGRAGDHRHPRVSQSLGPRRPRARGAE